LSSIVQVGLHTWVHFRIRVKVQVHKVHKVHKGTYKGKRT